MGEISELKSELKNSQNINKAAKKVCDKLIAMDDDTFRRLIAKHKAGHKSPFVSTLEKLWQIEGENMIKAWEKYQ